MRVKPVGILLTMILALLVSACGDGTSADGTGPQAVASVGLSSGVGSVVADSGSDPVAIIATVLDANGTAVPSVIVRFSTTLGTLVNDSGVPTTEASTNGLGVARLKLQPGTVTGSALVNATVSGFAAQTSVQFIAGPPGTVTVLATPATINPNSTAAIQATVLDANANPVPGEVVNFSLTTNPSQGALSDLSATTNVNGQATVSYTAGNTDGTNTVQARTASNNVIGSADVVVNTDAMVVDAIILSSGAGSVVADSGSDPVAIIATVFDADGTAVPSVVVKFSTTLGTLVNDSGVPTTEVTTNGLGVARLKLQPGTVTGSALVNATVSGFAAQTSVQFIAGSPSTVSVLATPATIDPNGTAAIQATVLDANGNPVPGEVVNFSLTTNPSQGALSPLSTTTNVNGQASVSYTAGSTDGTNTVQARTASNNVIGTVDVTVLAAPIGSITVSAGSNTLPTGGSSTAVRATVLDIYGQPVVGRNVAFTASAGSISTPVTTNHLGVAATTLFSANIAGNATVTADTGGFTAATVIQYVAALVAEINLQAQPATIPPGGSTTLQLQALDSDDNPVPDQYIQLRFTTTGDNSGGRFAESAVTTDANGRADVTYTAGSTLGTDEVEALTAEGIQSPPAQITIDSSAYSIGSMALTATDDTLVANGVTNTILRATVLQSNGQPASGVTVTFTVNEGAGKFPPDDTNASADTDLDGVAEVTLTSPTRTAVAIVQAATAGFSEQIAINFIPGSPVAAKSLITATPASLPADGTSITTISVLLVDANDNPVADGTAVNLITTNGTIVSDNPALTGSGRAEFDLRAANTQSVAVLTVAQVGGLSGSVEFGTDSDGDPANILTTVDRTLIHVAGVGKTEQARVTIEVRDSAGNPVADTEDPNISISFVTAPNGGEFISGGGEKATIGSSMVVNTTGGSVTLNLQAGTLPGVVEVKVEAIRSADGTPLNPVLTTSLPQIVIASGPPHTINLSTPNLDSVEDLGGGFYRRRGTASVTDRYGNAVPDGTPIYLGLLDSIIVEGTDGVTASGNSTLTAASAPFAGTISRNNTSRGILPGDRILLENANAGDKSRVVQALTANNTLTAQSAYLATATGLRYAVGAAMLGSFISGLDQDDNLIAGATYTTHGLAPVRVTYPANVNTILTGCYGYTGAGNYWNGDTRYDEPNSAQVWVVAESSFNEETSNQAVTIRKGQFCFAAISGATLTAVPGALSSSGPVTLQLIDGGDEVELPFVPISSSVVYETNTGGLDVDVDISASNNRTGANGSAVANITIAGGASGDSATVTFYALDATADVTVTIP